MRIAVGTEAVTEPGVQADDHGYWEGGFLPTFERGRYRDQSARAAHDADPATRAAAYRQIERVERCTADQRDRNEMGDVWLQEDATVARCRPDEALIAISHAVDVLRKLSH